MDEAQDSKIIRAGSRTYFFDIKEAKTGKKFLVITESRFKGEGEERQRQSLMVFPENIEEFIKTVQEMGGKISSQGV